MARTDEAKMANGLKKEKLLWYPMKAHQTSLIQLQNYLEKSLSQRTELRRGRGLRETCMRNPQCV